MRRSVLVFAFLAVVVAIPALAKDRRKPSEQYADKEKAFLRAVAAKYVELAAQGRKLKLFQFAREAYEEALKYEENNRDARKWLGYVRKSSGWVIDPAEAKKMPEQNQKPQNMHQSDFDKLVKKYRESEKKVGLYVGRKYSGLGKWCDKEGLSDQAKKAWEKAIRFDPDNEVARTGLGFKLVDGKWRTEKQIRAIKEAKEGRLVNDSPSRYEGPLGIKLNKMESAHFRIETVYAPDDLREYVKNCEQAYAYFLRDVGEEELKAVWSSKAFFLVLDNQEQWHRYVDLFTGGSDRQKNFTKQCKGSSADPSLHSAQYMGADGDHAGVIDGLVHRTSHFLVHHYWNITNQAWLKEGFAYYYTLKMLESTRWHCLALGDYNNPGGGMKDWGESQNWKELLKEQVLGHGDPDVRMFHAQPISDLQFQASVKSWSMITWLFDKHREPFMKWLTAVGREGRKQEEALHEIFGWSFEELDKEWRDYVRENY